MPDRCSTIMAVPTPGYLSGISIKAETEDCPMTVGQDSHHIIEFTNGRSNNVYDVEFTVWSIGKKIDFNGITRWYHIEPVIAGPSTTPMCPPQAAMAALAGSEGSTEEINCRTELSDPNSPCEQTSFAYNVPIQ